MARGSIGLDEQLDSYIVASHPPEHPVLAKLRAKTQPMSMSVMQIPPAQGHFLQFLVRLIGARKTLEIGTFTGYSALAVALALPADGKVMALDISKEWTDIGRPFWKEAGVEQKIDLRLAPALQSLAALEKEGGAKSFDFAFIDAEKTEYDAYYEAVLRLMRANGLIALDNMLQSGEVADPKARGKSTVAIRALNTKLAGDHRVEAVLLPLGDGVTLARVK
jgi:O-methyltransferase